MESVVSDMGGSVVRLKVWDVDGLQKTSRTISRLRQTAMISGTAQILVASWAPPIPSDSLRCGLPRLSTRTIKTLHGGSL